MQMQEKKVKGFSLLELLVVVAIIGVLSAVSFKPFMNWRTDRIVRTEALNVTAVIQNIFSQVQRGKYSFVQFKIEKDGNQYSVSSNGMEIEKFTDYVRDKYDGSTLKNFHKFETRFKLFEVFFSSISIAKSSTEAELGGRRNHFHISATTRNPSKESGICP